MIYKRKRRATYIVAVPVEVKYVVCSVGLCLLWALKERA